VRSVEAPVFFTHAGLQRRYDCSRWARLQIRKSHYPEPVKLGYGVGARPHWSVPLVLEWENGRMPAPLQRSAES
jgi:hypothetical protein